MKHNAWVIFGRILGFASWPFVYVVIGFTTRTRVLIVCDEQILVLQGWMDTGAWSLPGGGVHGGETPEQAAVREVKEETGIVLDESKLQSLGALRQTRGHKYPFYGFVVQLDKKPDVKARTSEVNAARWVSRSELEPLRRAQHVDLMLSTWQLGR